MLFLLETTYIQTNWYYY